MYLIIDRDLLPVLKGHIACSHDIGRYHKIHAISSDLARCSLTSPTLALQRACSPKEVLEEGTWSETICSHFNF